VTGDDEQVLPAHLHNAPRLANRMSTTTFAGSLRALAATVRG
jgi:hypothetical protein